MNTKRLITALATIAVLVLTSGLLSSCTKSPVGDLGNYTVLIASCDAASRTQAEAVKKKMETNIANVTAGSTSVTRMDSAIIAVLGPIYTGNKTVGNFVISIIWNGISTGESVNVRDYTFTKQTN